jgi:methylmalonyl-CoA mutase
VPARQAPPAGAVPLIFDDDPWSDLRRHAARLSPAPTVRLITVGDAAAARARLGFAAGLFPAAGLTVASEGGAIACLCGSDEAYAAGARDAARAARAAGVRRVLLAGKPAADRENVWRAAGVDDFVFAGSDVVSALAACLEVLG